MNQLLLSKAAILQPRSPQLRAAVWLALFAVVSVCGKQRAWAWGPSAHRLTNEWAIDTLPAGIREFFQANQQVILEHSDDPYQWIKKDPYERMRHYIYLNKYGLFPYLDLPHSYKSAIQKYGLGHITHNGVLPWQVGAYSLKLTNAFKAHDWQQALLAAVALSYYVADAHDPLHTTQNYDGQLTEQAGLEARFGDALVDRYSHFFMFRPSDASKIDDPTEYAFQMVLESHTWVEQIVLADRLALDDLPSYTDEYYDRFYSRVGSTAMREISQAGHDVGSYWYTAWLNAGRPELPRK